MTVKRAVRENQIVTEESGEINKYRRTRLDYFASQLVAVDNADAVPQCADVTLEAALDADRQARDIVFARFR